MNKAITYTRNGAIILGLGNGLLNLFNQLNNKTDAVAPLDWNKLLIATGKGAIIGATGGFVLGSVEDKRMSGILNESGGSLPKYLNSTLNDYDDSDNYLLTSKAHEIKRLLNTKFRNEIVGSPKFNGSCLKGTSIQGSDIDIHLRFKKHESSIEHIYNSVYMFLKNELNAEAITIRRQKHSIGVVYELDSEIMRIDVVPSRTSNNTDNDDYIFVNSASFFTQPSFRKINTRKQLKVLNFTHKERKIIKLLKIWKNENNINLKSIYLELLVKKAFEHKIPSRNIDKCLLDVLNYIANNISKLRIVDPANSNNIISDTLTYGEKIAVRDSCFDMISEIKKDKRNIIDFFPVN